MARFDVDTLIHGLNGVTARLVLLVSWMLVGIVHTALLAAWLLAMWVLQVTPSDVAEAVQRVLPASVLSSVPGMLAFLGLPSAAALVAYAKAWQMLMRWLTNRYVTNFD